MLADIPLSTIIVLENITGVSTVNPVVLAQVIVSVVVVEIIFVVRMTGVHANW